MGKKILSTENDNEDTKVQLSEEKPNTKYTKWSKMIRHLKNFENPTTKIQLLVKVTNQVKKEIDNFWHGVEVNQDDKCIDADNMEKILSYVIMKSKYQKIVVDLAIIELFSGNHIDFGCNGFIYVWIQQSLGQILNESVSEQNSKTERTTPYFNDSKRKIGEISENSNVQKEDESFFTPTKEVSLMENNSTNSKEYPEDIRIISSDSNN